MSDDKRGRQSDAAMARLVAELEAMKKIDPGFDADRIELAALAAPVDGIDVITNELRALRLKIEALMKGGRLRPPAP